MRILQTPILISLLLVASCTSLPIDQEPVQYKATKPLNENGTSDFTVRSYEAGADRKEIKGVPCVFKGLGFIAKFTTPAVVISPNMGPRTPVASLTCTYEGMRSFEIVKPVNRTVADINANARSIATNAGLIGAIVGEIAAAHQRSRRDPTLDVYGYPNLAATFKKPE